MPIQPMPYYNNLGQALSEMGEEDSAFFYFGR